jgi:predicted unusual protein kinase regulating ubiquinone biosynthesis (AarF/ABC1/UbiB family)
MSQTKISETNLPLSKHQVPQELSAQELDVVTGGSLWLDFGIVHEIEDLDKKKVAHTVSAKITKDISNLIHRFPF